MGFATFIVASLYVVSVHAQGDSTGASWQQEGAFAARRDALLQGYASKSGGGPYNALAALALEKAPRDGAFDAAINALNAREDCADFRAHAILRLLFQFHESPSLSPELAQRAKQSLLGFKYWPDEPGIDSMCSWSENHQIMFSAAGYLAGQLYPDELFTNTRETGREKMARHRARILRWLEFRFRTGFSEWLSNVYYDEDMAPLVNLIDFCDDPEIRERAMMVADLLALDMALNSFRGRFASTHGRTYEQEMKWGSEENTSVIQWLLFGQGCQSGDGAMSATYLALSKRYMLPQVIAEIANDTNNREFLNRQRMGIRLADAKQWKLGFREPEDGMVWLSLEAYTHPRSINLFVDMLDTYHWWDNDFFAAFDEHRRLLKFARTTHLLPCLARAYEWDLTRNLREEVNLYTYRTPDFMLSTAQDYRKGMGGDQQLIWQASLGPDATCFTTHPARRTDKSPSYWTGSGQLPRAGQFKNVAIVVYRIRNRAALYVPNEHNFTHAWFPKDQFDEVLEEKGWIFGRKGGGFIALRPQRAYRWQADAGADRDREIIMDGKNGIWLCELGSVSESGSFESFVKAIGAAPLHFDGLHVEYQSPSQGQLEFGWTGPFRRNGESISLKDYPRYENSYVQSSFPLDELTVRHGANALYLNWPQRIRELSENK